MLELDITEGEDIGSPKPAEVHERSISLLPVNDYSGVRVGDKYRLLDGLYEVLGFFLFTPFGPPLALISVDSQPLAYTYVNTLRVLTPCSN